MITLAMIPVTMVFIMVIIVIMVVPRDLHDSAHGVLRSPRMNMHDTTGTFVHYHGHHAMAKYCQKIGIWPIS